MMEMAVAQPVLQKLDIPVLVVTQVLLIPVVIRAAMALCMVM